MSEIRLGVIGAGHIAVEHLKVIEAIDNVRVKGITSRTTSKAEDLANIYSIEKVFDNSSKLSSTMFFGWINGISIFR